MGWSIRHAPLNQSPGWLIPDEYDLGEVEPGSSTSVSPAAVDPEGEDFEFFRAGGDAPEGITVSTGVSQELVVTVSPQTPDGDYTIRVYVRPVE